MDFVDLHLHSTFSHLDGAALPDQIVERAKSLGRSAIALTDHGSVSGFVQLDEACRKYTLRPIYGYEAYIVDNLERMFSEKERRKNHITILAKNNNGYRNLLALASEAYRKGFYYRPTIDEEMLFSRQEGLIVFSGCWSGKLQQHLQSNDVQKATTIAQRYRGVFGNRYFLETQHFDLFKETIQALRRVSELTEIPIVATCDPHYLEASGAEIQEILHAIRDGRSFDANKILYGAHQWTANDLYNVLQNISPEMDWGEVLERSVQIASEINVELPRGGAPQFPLAPTENSFNVLSRECYQGLLLRNIDTERYRERLAYELDIVQQKNFSDYFLIVADAVRWAHEHRILTSPARGSSAGSLICFVLGINEIDPIKHDLIFERFISLDRFDYPDIDLDFEREKRTLVKTYVAQKYGEDRVTNIATFAQFKGKNSLDDIGRVFNIPKSVTEKIKDELVDHADANKRSQLVLRETFEISDNAKLALKEYPALAKAQEIEGQYRQFGRHAAGIVISTQPLNEIMAIYKSSSDEPLASFDMDDLGKLGLLKFDFLGITELSVIRYAFELAGKTFEDISKISLEDEKTIAGFQNVDVTGIFQYGGDATRKILQRMAISGKITFRELVDCVALSKPGPSRSGGAESYLNVMSKQSNEGFNWHPKLQEITKDTYSQILYQEQIMRILREIGNMNWTDTGNLRKIVAKSKGDQAFETYWDKFLNGCRANSLDQADARKLWDAMKVFGRYSFNKAHAVSYAALGFWDMYAKQHFPLPFYTAKLTYEYDEDNKRQILKQVATRFALYPPKVGKSGKTWRIEENGIRAGFQEIKGIGEKTVEKILDKNAKLTQRFVNLLNQSHAMDEDDNYDFFNLGVFRTLDDLAPQRTKTIDIPLRESKQETVLAGLIVDIQLRNAVERAKTEGKTIKDPHLAHYALVTLEDDEGQALLVVNRYVYPKCSRLLQTAKETKNPVVASGSKFSQNSILSVNRIEAGKQKTQATKTRYPVELDGSITKCDIKEHDGKKYAVLMLNSVEEGNCRVGVPVDLFPSVYSSLTVGAFVVVRGEYNNAGNTIIAKMIESL